MTALLYRSNIDGLLTGRYLDLEVIDSLWRGLSFGPRIPGSDAIRSARDLARDFLQERGFACFEESHELDSPVLVPTRASQLTVDDELVPCAEVLNSSQGSVEGRLFTDGSLGSLSGTFDTTMYFIMDADGERKGIVHVVDGADYVAALPLMARIQSQGKNSVTLSYDGLWYLPQVIAGRDVVLDALRSQRKISLTTTSQEIRSIDNLVVTLHEARRSPSRSSKKETIYFVAHLDSVPFYESDGTMSAGVHCGVVDNASGVVLSLVLASFFGSLSNHERRALKPYDVKLLLTSGEEYGRVGAFHHFFERAEDDALVYHRRDDCSVPLAFNLDSISDEGEGIVAYLCHPQRDFRWFMSQYASNTTGHKSDIELDTMPFRSVTDALVLGCVADRTVDITTADPRVRYHTTDDVGSRLITPAHIQHVAKGVYKLLYMLRHYG